MPVPFKEYSVLCLVHLSSEGTSVLFLFTLYFLCRSWWPLVLVFPSDKMAEHALLFLSVLRVVKFFWCDLMMFQLPHIVLFSLPDFAQKDSPAGRFHSVRPTSVSRSKRTFQVRVFVCFIIWGLNLLWFVSRYFHLNFYYRVLLIVACHQILNCGCSRV